MILKAVRLTSLADKPTEVGDGWEVVGVVQLAGYLESVAVVLKKPTGQEGVSPELDEHGLPKVV